MACSSFVVKLSNMMDRKFAMSTPFAKFFAPPAPPVNIFHKGTAEEDFTITPQHSDDINSFDGKLSVVPRSYQRLVKQVILQLSSKLFCFRLHSPGSGEVNPYDDDEVFYDTRSPVRTAYDELLAHLEHVMVVSGTIDPAADHCVACTESLYQQVSATPYGRWLAKVSNTNPEVKEGRLTYLRELAIYYLTYKECDNVRITPVLIRYLLRCPIHGN